MATEITSQLDHVRRRISKNHRRRERSRIGQFLTPAPIAHFMAGLFQRDVKEARILDAGAGAGVLSAAAVETFISRKGRLRSIEVTAYESDELVLPYLEDALTHCEAVCAEADITFHAKTQGKDFVADGVVKGQHTPPTVLDTQLIPFICLPERQVNVVEIVGLL